MGRFDSRVEIHSLKNQTVIADKCIVAERFFVRLRGLIGRGALAPGEGMLFPRNNSIHMWFMSIPIDVVFLRREKDGASDAPAYSVISVHRGVRPWRLLPLFDWRATETLELPTGTIERCGLAEGDRLCTS